MTAFKKQIEEELKELDTKQIVFFAWLCGVRALPLLGAKGHFDFWEKEKVDRHLLSLLQALDIAYRFTVRPDESSTHVALIKIGIYAQEAANAADAANADDEAAHYAAASISSAAYTAFSAAEAKNLGSCTASVCDAIVYATETAICATEAARRYKIDLNLIPTIHQDLSLIRDEQTNDFNHDTALYGQVWDLFQTALQDVRCEYWGKLYEWIFAKGFMLDEEDKAALERRLNVPGEVREEGALKVAHYLKNLGDDVERLNEDRSIIR
ncbi:MAG: hypothetical protein LBV40_02990 [Methanomicrobiales archaeon]|jgi:hypothetical protein|nr:hypothetical protein [Methanomicrobiales archaeon]